MRFDFAENEKLLLPLTVTRIRETLKYLNVLPFSDNFGEFYETTISTFTFLIVQIIERLHQCT